MNSANLAHVEPYKKATHRNSVLRELREMQKVAFSLCMSPETKASDVAQLMRAHVAAEQQRSDLRMKPKPRPVDVSTLPKRKQPGIPKANTVQAIAPE